MNNFKANFLMVNDAEGFARAVMERFDGGRVEGWSRLCDLGNGGELNAGKSMAATFFFFEGTLARYELVTISHRRCHIVLHRSPFCHQEINIPSGRHLMPIYKFLRLGLL